MHHFFTWQDLIDKHEVCPALRCCLLPDKCTCVCIIHALSGLGQQTALPSNIHRSKRGSPDTGIFVLFVVRSAVFGVGQIMQLRSLLLQCSRLEDVLPRIKESLKIFYLRQLQELEGVSWAGALLLPLPNTIFTLSMKLRSSVFLFGAAIIWYLPWAASLASAVSIVTIRSTSIIAKKRPQLETKHFIVTCCWCWALHF